MKEVPIGARAEITEVVERKHTLTHHREELPPVYSTPDMIRLMETAGFHVLLPYHEAGEISVGTAIHVDHRAATGIGTEVHASAELASFDGRFYVLKVRAWVEAPTGQKEIGSGTISRAIVHVPTFLGRMRDRKK